MQLVKLKHLLNFSHIHDDSYHEASSDLLTRHDAGQTGFARVVVPAKVQAIHVVGSRLAGDRSGEVQGRQAHITLWEGDLGEATIGVVGTGWNHEAVSDDRNLVVTVEHPSSNVELAGAVQVGGASLAADVSRGCIEPVDIARVPRTCTESIGWNISGIRRSCDGVVARNITLGELGSIDRRIRSNRRRSIGPVVTPPEMIERIKDEWIVSIRGWQLVELCSVSNCRMASLCQYLHQ